MKKRFIFIYILVVLILFVGAVEAKYIINKNLNFNFNTEQFYFQADAINNNIIMDTDVATIKLSIKNFHDANLYNNVQTQYTISLQSNNKFTFSSDMTTSGTISGGSCIQKDIDVRLVPIQTDTLSSEESVTIKITTTSPYTKEINIPVIITYFFPGEERFSDIYGQNALYTDPNGQTAWIPKGFAVGISGNINKVNEGLVITDSIDANHHSTGNEFVWIPVNLTGTDAEKSLAFDKIRTTYGNSSYSEPSTSGYTTEVEDYNKMKSSIIKYGGFFIGRYESGTSKLRYGISNGTSADLVIKKGAYLYNYIPWGASMSNYTNDITDLGGLKQGKGAVYLSKNMYTNYTTYGVTSTLCYGVQWDAAMNFIEKGNYNISNSLAWGNYTNSSFIFTGSYSSDPATSTSWKSATDKNKTSGSKWLMTTGASEQNKSKNIYDLAGNVAEWTMESMNQIYRVRRGGHRSGSNSDAYAALREGFKPDNSLFSYGFRVALYLNDN